MNCEGLVRYIEQRVAQEDASGARGASSTIRNLDIQIAI